jgi:polysaccharide export outer membrane protein
MRNGWVARVLLLGSALAVSSCAARIHEPSGQPEGAPPLTELQFGNAPTTTADNLQRLADLHAERSAQKDDREYVLGPGDVLAIRAFDFEDLNQHVRVDDDGTITVPLLETIAVAGRTVTEVQSDLTTRLGEYMFEPHITVFVEEYRSQHVSVIGAVRKPGLVTLTNRGFKVLDAISAAGGMGESASGRIYLLPAEARTDLESGAAIDIADPALEQTLAMEAAQGGAAAQPATSAPIMIDTNQVGQGVESFFFSLPVRPGDVVVVANSGHFLIQGWVDRPGTYPLRPGLTLRGAMATGGGLSFPAKKNCVRVFRLAPAGGTTMYEVNYEDILERTTPDIFIQEGDVIEVASSKLKLVPYGFYKVAVDVIRVGARLPLIP